MNEQLSSIELGEIVDNINTLLKSNNFKAVDDLLSETKIDNMTIAAIVAYLRCPYIIREQLPSWKQFLTDAYSVIEQRGYDPKRILRGLT